MVNSAVAEAMNEQINLEMYSGYLYLALSLVMEEENYKGYSAWLSKHYMEELAHAQDFIKFMQKRNIPVKLKDIKVVEIAEKDPLEIAKLVYAHEQKVTASIYKLHDVAKKNDDYATEIFLHSYIAEQIEEEDLTESIIDKFTFAHGNQAAMYAVDKEVAAL